MAASCPFTLFLHVSSTLTGVLFCGPLLQCHHRVEPVLLLAVLSITFALARVSTGQKQDHRL